MQALMPHANASVAMNTFVQAVTPAKRQAQHGAKLRQRNRISGTQASRFPTSASASHTNGTSLDKTVGRYSATVG